MLVSFKKHWTHIKMLDVFIYKTIDWCITKLQEFREWRIQRSLPKSESVKEWAKKNGKL